MNRHIKTIRNMVANNIEKSVIVNKIIEISDKYYISPIEFVKAGLIDVNTVGCWTKYGSSESLLMFSISILDVDGVRDLIALGADVTRETEILDELLYAGVHPEFGNLQHVNTIWQIIKPFNPPICLSETTIKNFNKTDYINHPEMFSDIINIVNSCSSNQS